MTDPLQTPNSPLRNLLDALPFVDAPRYETPIVLTPAQEQDIDAQVTAAIGNDRWPPEGQRTSDEQQAWSSWNESRDLLNDAYTQAETTGDAALGREADQVATLNHDREILALSRAIAPDDDVPPGWSRATPAQLEAYGISETDLRPTGDDTGFRAELFIPDPEIFGEDAVPVLQFEGTNFGDLADVNADVAQAMGNDEAFYNQAISIAQRVNEASEGDIIFSGHSLGGGLATAASLATGAPAIVSNPAGVNPVTVEDALADRGINFEDADAGVTTYAVDGDVLTELQAATGDMNQQNADSFAAILNGVGIGLNAYQDDVVFPTDATGQQVLDLPDAVGTRVVLDARNGDGSDRPEITTLDSIVSDINDHVEAMPVDEFAGLVEDGTDIIDDVTGVLGGIANGTGDVLNTISDHVPDFGIFGGAGDVVSGGGDVVTTMGDYVEEGGDITLDIAEGLETAGAVAIEAADGDVRDSMMEMVDRHSFPVFDGSMQAQIDEQEAALRDRLDG